MTTEETPWYEDHPDLIAFARVLEDCGELTDAESAIRFFDAPYDWTPEHEQWVALGRPDSVEDIDELRRELVEA